MELDTLYLTVLLVSGGVTIIYVLLSDVFDSIAIFDSWLSPAFVLSAISFFSASAYLLEKFSPLSGVVSAGISLVVASMLAILFNLFILTPLRRITEESTAYSEEDLEGEYGETPRLPRSCGRLRRNRRSPRQRHHCQNGHKRGRETDFRWGDGGRYENRKQYRLRLRIDEIDCLINWRYIMAVEIMIIIGIVLVTYLHVLVGVFVTRYRTVWSR